MKLKENSKICILRLSAIGDVCHTLALGQAILREFPKAEITWIIGKTEFEVFKNIKNINFITFDKTKGLKEIFRIWQALKTVQFDALLHLQTAIRASVLSLGIKAKRKIGFDLAKSKEGQRFFINEMIEPSDKVHIVDVMMQFAKNLGVKDLTPTWHLPLDTLALQNIAQFIKPNCKNILICPCSSKVYKDWSLENYIEICNWLIEKNCNVVLTASKNPREIDFVKQIENKAPKTLNIAGKTNLQELSALVSQVDLVIAPDTAVIHLANIYKIPVIGLYAIHNPKRTGPYNQLDNVVSVFDELILKQFGKSWQELPWKTHLKGVKENNFMQFISKEMVQDQIIKILGI